MTGRGTTGRRAFLSAAGVTGAALLAGCLGGSGGGNGTTEGNDGYPPTPDEQPEERSIDTSGFARKTVNGTEVPLAPIDVTHYWHLRREARFVDARGSTQYGKSHVLGAVLSTAPDGVNDDPTASWPKEDRVVCYCGCPHHLSSLRAANLIDNGYENVFVIDEGFWEWYERGYPMSGSKISNRPASYEIRGEVGAEYAGETAWAWHDSSGQREAGPIGDDGSYLLELTFSGITRSSPIRIETPTYELEAPLSDLLSGVVTAPDA
ncbi:rhodanese-like domain-containing protein (plasmid) [Halorarum halophilum]|uniref:Rhodanese-like domain-containing protein n=1 Tax=Halorarum halophilum TaxID=2743090 RepID=A0A7D5GED0_9EURY|nr:rhodanese-like domain-containing protein [Halobaculum halophilum]QLG29692.1 rhodanese-like domain-containing protein [Halobaculum halophilum]